MQTAYRTHTCGDLRLAHVGQTVSLGGWVQTTRDFGKFIFVDLRDRYGITQVAIRIEDGPELYAQAKALGREYVLHVTGTVVERENKNPKLPTGDIEVRPTRLDIISAAALPPFLIDDDTDGAEDLRLQYRYLDLRRPVMQQRLLTRAKVVRAVRQYLDSLHFVEVETPCLIKSTPEGARDFIVPSRLQPGQFYALPQSPQILKQLLMVAGMDRYYQIVKCFRDEDFRGDRQPEFTQIDCEMAFVGQDDILNTFEGMTKHVFREVKGIELPDFPRITYAEAMSKYGTDKPDLRFGMPLHELNTAPAIAALADTVVFKDALAKGLVLAITVKGGASLTRKEIDHYTDYVKRPQLGGKGLFWIRLGDDGIKTSGEKILSFASYDDFADLATRTGAERGDLLLLVADASRNRARKVAGELRLELGRRLGLIDPNAWSVFWVVDFPLMERDEDTNALIPVHHPFVMPHPDDWHYLDTPTPDQARALCYDLVMNGSEIVSGSVRIHRSDIQAKIFDLLGLSEAEQQEKFGFLLNAFKYGAPPHAGCAFGLDRWVMLLTGGDTIRDVIAYPKNSAGRDMMLDAPGPIAPDALRDLGIALKA